MLENLNNIIEKYRGFVLRVDGKVEALFGEQQEFLNCRSGCDACCQERLSFYAIEVFWVASLLASWPNKEKDAMLSHLKSCYESQRLTPCPMLDNGLCMVYTARPILCRTHGLPLSFQLNLERETKEADPKGQISEVRASCALNHQKAPESFFTAEKAINQTLLTNVLFQLNASFLKDIEVPTPQRQTLDEALFWMPYF